MVSTVGWLYFAQGRMDLSFKLSFFGGPFILGALYLGVLGGSSSTVALSYLLMNVVTVPVLLAVGGSLVNIKLRDYFHKVKDIVAAALVAAGAAYLVRTAGVHIHAPALVRLLVGSVAGAGVYGLLCTTRKMPEIRMIGQLATRFAR
jgi:hypothetical protein